MHTTCVILCVLKIFLRSNPRFFHRMIEGEKESTRSASDDQYRYFQSSPSRFSGLRDLDEGVMGWDGEENKN